MEKKKVIALYIVASISLIINFILVKKTGSYLVCLLLPAFVAFAYCLIYYPQKLLFLSVFLVPLSIPLIFLYPNLSFNVDLPTEPIFVMIIVVFMVKQILDKDYDTLVFRHPVSIVIILYLLWRFFLIFTSSMPIVSLKDWISTIWFILPFYFILVVVFREKKKIFDFLWLYMLGFIIVILISLFKHADSGFIQKTSHSIMYPFFNDHTSYGAALAMCFPVLLGFLFNKGLNKKMRIASFFVLILFVIALVFSYTRAAWLSLFISFLIYIVLKLKINFRFLFLVGIIVFLGLFSAKDQILQELESNKQDSSSNFTEHISSMTNVATDASNLERINRWKSAIRMFEERPVLGWGPGTYQFNYAPFQTRSDITVISTNFGNAGNAHSEYLGDLSETGMPGFLLLIAMLSVIWISGVNTYKKVKPAYLKSVVLSLLIGLSTYYIHALMNNFLDIDKIAVPFWGMVAAIVSIDLYSSKNESSEKEEQSIIG